MRKLSPLDVTSQNSAGVPIAPPVITDCRPFKNAQTRHSDAAMVRKIGLLNHMGGGNLGDDATQDAVMQNIRRRWPDAEIVLFSMNPADTSSRHGVTSYQIRIEFGHLAERNANVRPAADGKVKSLLRKCRPVFLLLHSIKRAAIRVRCALLDEPLFLMRSLLILRSLDLLIISGGGQLLDSWGGPWKFPYTIFKWTLLAKLSGKKCYFLNVGAGPLAHPLAKWFVRKALSLADYISFRDTQSSKLIESIGFKGHSQVAPDCVYALEFSAAPASRASAREAPLVGISPMAYCDPRVYWQKDPAVYERFIHNVACFGDWLGRNHCRLALFSTDIWFDLRTIREVDALLESTNRHPGPRVRYEIAGLNELLSTMRSMDYVVTCRFHGVVFAHLLNKPVIALSHHPKVSTLMSELGLQKYCLDIRKCDLNLLQETFLCLQANQEEIRARMAEKAAIYRRVLWAQFDRLFAQVASI